MSLRVNLLQFLTDYGHLKEIERQCCAYTARRMNESQEIMAVYKLALLIDPVQLLEANFRLGDDLLHHPSKAWLLFQEVIFTIIKEMEWLPHLNSTTQLLLLLRLKSLPELSGYTIQHISDFPQFHDEPRFLTFTGVICSMSVKEKYTESACFYCPNSSCNAGRDNKYIRMHSAGATEAMTMRGDLSCSYCGSTLTEDIAFRILADKMLIQMVPNESFYDDKNVRYQGITVVLRDELCSNIEMGGEYTVLGIPVHKTHQTNGRTFINSTLEANNIYSVNCVPKVSMNPVLPPHIRDIFTACQYSPWVFAATLAYSFAAQIYPPGIYHRLKLALLLSVAASTNEREKMIDLLVIGTETHHINQLMKYTSSFFTRRVIHNSVSDMTGSVRKDDKHWIDGGSLLLARSGVCLLGNIGNWKKETKEIMQQTLESKQVSVKTRKPDSDIIKHITWPLHCTIWSTCDSHMTMERKGVHQPLQDQISLPRHLIDQLGLILLTDPYTQDNEELVYNVLTTHILQKSMGHNSIPPLTHEDFIQLLAISSSLPVSLSQSAHSLLKGFYLSSRRARGSGLHGSDTPLNALDTMIALSLSHARLSLRKEAVEEDAVLAIMLYEEALVHKTGYSTLFIQPLPHMRNENISEYIGKEFNLQMRDVHHKILNFVKNHGSHLTNYSSSPIWPEE